MAYLCYMQEAFKQVEYVPGNCNIGPEEINKRLRIGYLGLAGMAIFILLDVNFQFPHIWKLVLFAPTAYALSGFLQARQHFCFMYGIFGLFSISGKRVRVRDDLQLKKDRSKALWLVLQIFVGSTIITLAYYFLS